MSPRETLKRYLEECPLIAIIRGVIPDQAEAVGEAVQEAGIRIIEVPLNSPDPIKSIERLAKRFGETMLVGGGTILRPLQVRDVREAGGQLIVSPNTNPDVISATAQANLVSCPGYFTPSEAFSALNAGASALKLFPAEGASPSVLKAQMAVIPKDVPIIVVGGVKSDSMHPWIEAGAAGFGLGSGLYQPGQSPAETLEKARTYVAEVRR